MLHTWETRVLSVIPAVCDCVLLRLWVWTWISHVHFRNKVFFPCHSNRYTTLSSVTGSSTTINYLWNYSSILEAFKGSVQQVIETQMTREMRKCMIPECICFLCSLVIPCTVFRGSAVITVMPFPQSLSIRARSAGNCRGNLTPVWRLESEAYNSQPHCFTPYAWCHAKPQRWKITFFILTAIYKGFF